MNHSMKQRGDDLQSDLCRDVEALRTLADLIELNGHQGGDTLRTPAEHHIGISILLNLIADSARANIETLGDYWADTVALAQQLDAHEAEQARRERQPLSTSEGMQQHVAMVFSVTAAAGADPAPAKPQ